MVKNQNGDEWSEDGPREAQKGASPFAGPLAAGEWHRGEIPSVPALLAAASNALAAASASDLKSLMQFQAREKQRKEAETLGRARAS